MICLKEASIHPRLKPKLPNIWGINRAESDLLVLSEALEDKIVAMWVTVVVGPVKGRPPFNKYGYSFMGP